MATFTAVASSVQEWNLHTGGIESCRTARYDNDSDLGGIIHGIHNLPPCGSTLLFFSNKSEEPQDSWEPPDDVSAVTPTGNLETCRLDPNVLTLDFVDLKIDEENQEAIYVCNAAKLIFQQHGMPQGNPWSRAVQFGDELITKTFPADSGFSASYRFTIEESVPKALEIVIERPDLYTITCNGKSIDAAKDAWWLDKAFGRLDLSDAAKIGENVVTLTAAPLTIYHELEPAYVIGGFGVEAAESGFTIKPAKPMELGSWKEQGMALYGHSVAYTREFAIAEKGGRYDVILHDWYGSVAKVVVNDEPAGVIGFQTGQTEELAWKLDVTDRIRPGNNTIEVIVIGTLKNTLGPHHAGKMVGKAWPHAFEQGPETGPPPGNKYDTLDYGLFEPFSLLNSR